MAALIDPATGLPLPADAIQRMLFVAAKVHVYQIPPLTSTKGYMAASWTTDPQRHIFTARLRVLETGTDSDEEETAESKTEDQPEKVKVDIVLEDPSTGQLFAAAPYTAADVVEAALDSARFYALRVQDPQGRKAMLGIGFEERPESFDFGVALQEARKTVGLDGGRAGAGAAGGGAAAAIASAGSSQLQKRDDAAAKRDYSLKDGETITVNLSSSKFGRRAAAGSSSSSSSTTTTSSSSISSGGLSLPPPPPPPSSSFSSSSSSPASSFSLPPPPPPNRRAAARRSVGDPSILGFNLQQQKKTAADLGFDDGQFNEFA